MGALVILPLIMFIYCIINVIKQILNEVDHTYIFLTGKNKKALINPINKKDNKCQNLSTVSNNKLLLIMLS